MDTEAELALLSAAFAGAEKIWDTVSKARNDTMTPDEAHARINAATLALEAEPATTDNAIDEAARRKFGKTESAT